ncbi:hypothetical protein DFJ58DRAFT_826302 [Suillus subalutaceus]|uniref:uncharacterized protein n=1 Tax=Suillus subalutaceus TaxID=48586 RepID=UPI001B86B7D6|nr:uncharacterized protein DFJ58DRAFT_826302 [Suillus subalutaceus]KAG1829017.1 hypothetical protein DFJ58DRAFT_826302 [Suillus subalutaceus]
MIDHPSFSGHNRRPSSLASHAHSAYSLAPSTRPILADMQLPLEPPAPLFAADDSSSAPPSPRAESTKDLSLSVNYLPNKFSSGLLSPTPRRRKLGKDNADHPAMHKRGGGREAFKSSEARMPAEGDEDYDGITGRWFGGKEGGHTRPRMHWNRFKWALFIANLALSTYALAGLIFCLLTWFDVFEHADIVRQSTLSLSGSALPSSLPPGYTTYKQRTFNLEGKLNAQWSRDLGAEGRLRIQNRLHCCGYYSPFVEATVSQSCYARSVLPGCKEAYVNFEKRVLEIWYTIAFSLVPLQLVIMLAGLLCSNHVTYRFGKGMMPKAYRLSMASMAVIMDNYANQLAEQYGTEVASDILARSRHLDSMTYTSGVANGTGTTQALSHGRYDSLAMRSPYTGRI